MRTHEITEHLRLRFLKSGALCGTVLGVIYPFLVILYGQYANPGPRGAVNTLSDGYAVGMALFLYGSGAGLIGLFVGSTAAWFIGLVAAELRRDHLAPTLYRTLLGIFSTLIALIFAVPVFLLLRFGNPPLVVIPGIVIAASAALIESQRIAEWILSLTPD